ncbi:MAG: tRNA pseudouridine(55) synthase TruB [Rickettsiales bacterium]
MNLYNGWLIINKPIGVTSNDIVVKVKRLFGKDNKVGHAGTLDPLAEGVLPVAISEATKTTNYLMEAEKEYEFTVTWGEERSTADAEGEVIASGGITPSAEDINKVIPKFIGEILQVPPIYSALKIKGQPAYKLARKGVEVELAPRKILIKALELIEHKPMTNSSSFKVLCGKGTYVRSLAVDLARELSTYGYISQLKRTRVGNFFIKDAIMLANLINLVHNDEIKMHLLPVTYALGDILAVEVDAAQAKALKYGQQVFLLDYAQTSDQIAQILLDGVLQAIVCINKGQCKVLRVFNL